MRESGVAMTNRNHNNIGRITFFRSGSSNGSIVGVGGVSLSRCAISKSYKPFSVAKGRQITSACSGI